MGFIYIITSPSGKSYIGQTTRSVEKRIKEHFKCSGHCILLENALKKYGDAMITETLFEIDNSMLNTYETQLIELYGTLEPYGYNIRTGGSNGLHSLDSRERMRIAKTGSNNHNFGKPRSDSAKEAISLAKSGVNHHFYDKSLSHEHKLNLSKAHKQADLPMYLVYVKARPEIYQSSGYAIVNHPVLKNKYFTSKTLTDDDKLKLAQEHLNQYECSSETKW